MSLPITLVKAMNQQRTDVVYLALLELYHPDVGYARVVNNTQDVTSGGNLYSAVPFGVTMPPQSTDSPPVVEVVMSNVSLDMVRMGRTIAGSTDGPATGRAFTVAASDPDAIVEEYPGRKVKNFMYNVNMVTFQLSLETMTQVAFPSQTFSPGDYPNVH